MQEIPWSPVGGYRRGGGWGRLLPPQLRKPLDGAGGVHRAKSAEVRRILDKFLERVGQSDVGKLTLRQVKTLQREFVEAAKSNNAIKTFLERLERTTPNSTRSFWGVLSSGASELMVVVVVAPDVMLNIEKCGQAKCGGGLM
jgi:hypothetical protein